MKNIKIILSLALALLMGLASCDSDPVLPPVPVPDGGRIGTGTWDNPMTAYQARLGVTNNSLAYVWVTGYIVGCVNVDISGTLSANSADFTVPAPTEYNMLIALDPDEKDWEKCATVQLPSGAVRNALNLASNPDNLGKLVSIQGTTGDKYCGAYGIKNVIAYKFGDLGIEGSDIPAVTNPAKTIYSALGENDTAIDWTFENVNIPAGLESIWTWTEHNGRHYLNGSAYRHEANGILSYAVSPEIILPADYESLAVSFDHAASFQTTLRELCGFAVRIAGSTEWTELPIPTWPSTGAWIFVNSGNIDLSAYAGKTIQVAFKYGGSAAGADTWEVRNLNITGAN